MEEDSEQLDWGDNDDQTGQHKHLNATDTDDVVSLGGEEDDIQELVAFQCRTNVVSDSREASPLGPSGSTSRSRDTRRDVHEAQQHDERPSPSKSSYETSNSSQPIRATSSLKALLTHALPPKPVVHTIPPRSSLVDTSARASSMRGQEKERHRSNGPNKPLISDDYGALPPDWEVRRPRNASSEDQVYYFNSRTEVSQWARPTFKQSGKTSPQRSPNDEGGQEFIGFRAGKQDERDRASPEETRSERRHDSYRPSDRDDLPSREVSVALSYSDRHYRPSDPSDRVTGRNRGQRDTPPHRVRSLERENSISAKDPSTIERIQSSRRSPPRQPSPHKESDHRSIRPPTVENRSTNEHSRESISNVHGDDGRHRGSRPDLRNQDPPVRDSRARHDHPEHSQPRNHREHDALLGAALLTERRPRSRSPTLRNRERDHNERKIYNEYPESYTRPQRDVIGRADRSIHAPRLDRRESDVSMLDGSVSRRQRVAGFSPKDELGNDAKRRRTDRYDSNPSQTRLDRSPVARPSQSPATIPLPLQDEQYPHRTRGVPLDSQEDRFKSSNTPEKTHVSSPHTVANRSQRLPRGPRDNGVGSYNMPGIPSGPRNGGPVRTPPDGTLRDSRRAITGGPGAHDNDYARSRRDDRRYEPSSASVPSNIGTDRLRGTYLVVDESRDAMDVDALPPRQPGQVSSGAAEGRDVPTAPRAMHSRPLPGSGPSPTATIIKQKGPSMELDQERLPAGPAIGMRRSRFGAPVSNSRPNLEEQQSGGRAIPTAIEAQPWGREVDRSGITPQRLPPSAPSANRFSTSGRDHLERARILETDKDKFSNRTENRAPDGPKVKVTGVDTPPDPPRRSWDVDTREDIREVSTAAVPPRHPSFHERERGRQRDNGWSRPFATEHSLRPSPSISRSVTSPGLASNRLPDHVQRRMSFNESGRKDVADYAREHRASIADLRAPLARDDRRHPFLPDRNELLTVRNSMKTPTTQIEPYHQSQSWSSNLPRLQPHHLVTNVDLQPRTWIPRDQVPDGFSVNAGPSNRGRPITPPRSPSPNSVRSTYSAGGQNLSRQLSSEEVGRRHSLSRVTSRNEKTGGPQELQRPGISANVFDKERIALESRIVSGKVEIDIEKPSAAVRERRSKWGPPILDVQEHYRTVDKLPSPGEVLYSRISSSYEQHSRAANGSEREYGDDRDGPYPPVDSSERQETGNQQKEGRLETNTFRDSSMRSKRAGKEFEEPRSVDVGENRVLTVQRPQPSRGNSLLERLSVPERSMTIENDDRRPASSSLSLRERLAHAGDEKQDLKVTTFGKVEELGDDGGVVELTDKQDDLNQQRNKSGNRSRGGRHRRSRGKSSYSSRA